MNTVWKILSRKRKNRQSWIPTNNKNYIRRYLPPFEVGEILLRPLTSADAFADKQLCDVSTDHLNSYLGFAENISRWNLGQHKTWIANNQLAGYPFETYGAFYGKHLLGYFSYGQAGDLLGTQICYYVSKDCAGKGIATEVTSVMVQKAFTLAGFDYVELHIDEANIASQKVASKCGFTKVQDYSSSKIGKKGSGSMQLWIHVNPNNKHGITLNNFIEENYDYLVPVYQNIETFLTSSLKMKLIADKISRAEAALAGEIPLEDVQDIIDEHLRSVEKAEPAKPK